MKTFEVFEEDEDVEEEDGSAKESNLSTHMSASASAIMGEVRNRKLGAIGR
jgi:hypothetical protein